MRAQTTLDFAIGMSVFVAAVLFVFLFVPGILEPFTVGAQEETVATNRVADGLVQDQLGSPDRPNVLRANCTVQFFEQARDDPDGELTVCGREADNLTSFLGVKERQYLNVTVVGNVSAADDGSDVLCWDGADADGAELHERDDSEDCTDGSAVNLTAGQTPPARNDDAVTARRVAWLHGTDVTVTVEMW